jgi:hypothetical protein
LVVLLVRPRIGRTHLETTPIQVPRVGIAVQRLDVFGVVLESGAAEEPVIELDLATAGALLEVVKLPHLKIRKAVGYRGGLEVRIQKEYG